MEKLFEKLGLSGKESTVYLALLELGPALVTLVANRAGINRTTCYDILENLINLGLVSKVGGTSKKTYTAQPPESLVAYLEKQSEDFINKARDAKKILPELKMLYNEKGKRPTIRYYDGKQGIKTVYEDTLTSHETIRAYASVKNMHSALPDFFPNYYKRRKDKKIAIRAILPATADAKERKSFDKVESRESKLVPVDKFNFSPEINVYDNKVAIMSLAEEFGVIIESKEIAEAQKRIFELAWEAADKYNRLITKIK
jgi:sugar-specific transcriptional regulator TrmB